MNWLAVLCFLLALTMGTFSTLSSKVMYGMSSVDSEGHLKLFQKPLMQTFLMFLAMVIALPIHYVMEAYKRSNDKSIKKTQVPMKTYFILCLPAITDLTATALCMVGLLYVSVSVYQLVRCTVIIFVAILKYFVLRYDLKPYQWIGVFVNALAIVLVSGSAFFDPATKDISQVAIGIAILLLGCMIMSMQFVLEETVMSNADNGAPPLVVVGMEGLWGTLIMLFIVFPLAHALPGNDYGSLENVWDSLTMISNSSALQAMTVFYVLSITGFNVSAIFVTFLMDSVWRSILANFRPVAVWGADLGLYYFVTAHSFGEAWTNWSWLQLGGMFLLFFGTATYNATIRLRGFHYDESEIAMQVSMTPTSDMVMDSPYLTKRLSMKREAKKEQYGTFQGEDGKSRKSFKV